MFQSRGLDALDWIVSVKSFGYARLRFLSINLVCSHHLFPSGKLTGHLGYCFCLIPWVRSAGVSPSLGVNALDKSVSITHFGFILERCFHTLF